MPPITPFLWFDNQAEQAANFYISVFPKSKITTIARYGDSGPGPQGSVMTVEFELNGQTFTALNGGPVFKFDEAVSFVVPCKDQAEVDHYWEALSAGGETSQCGWLKDKFGLSWQVVPEILRQVARSGDAERLNRMMIALMKMTKLDVATLSKA